MSEQGVWNFDQGELPYRAQLHTTALRLTRSMEAAEDLLQETYLKAFVHYDRFRPGTNLKAWLFTILKNTFINDYRRRQKTPAMLPIADLEGSLESAIASAHGWVPPTPEDKVLTTALDGEVQHALAALPHVYRIVILLADIEGHTYREVAAILSIPVGTVMSRLFRGRRRLERALLSYGVRYNYLIRKPHRTRSRDLDLERVFGDETAPPASGQDIGRVLPT